MCLARSNIRAAAQWNWEGDVIVHNPIVPRSRRIPGTEKRYAIDIREYLSRQDNAVVGKTLATIIGELPPQEQALFRSHEPGSFDLRARKVTSYVAEHIRYEIRPRKFDDWLFPEETLAQKSGDCEDRAFLLASLLIAAGISGYVVRVALGKLYNQLTRASWDHVWVMYKNEDGMWMLIEPLLYTHRAREHVKALSHRPHLQEGPRDVYEYIPYFVFNDSHLWAMKSNTVRTGFRNYLKSRNVWVDFDPKFAASVHNDILDEALKDTEMSYPERLYVKAVSLAMDINPVSYDPRDHFDNGYVREGWDLLNERLGSKTLDGFAQAAHAAADFYAHTSYAHFAKKLSPEEIEVFDENQNPQDWDRPPDYGSGDFDLHVHDPPRFTANDEPCAGDLERSIAYWNRRQIISGRFGQKSDPHRGDLEKIFIQIPYWLQKKPDYHWRTCLPHHDEIAVDHGLKNGEPPERHRLYRDPTAYQAQYELRWKAAIRHIQRLYDRWQRARSSDPGAAPP